MIISHLNLHPNPRGEVSMHKTAHSLLLQITLKYPRLVEINSTNQVN